MNRKLNERFNHEVSQFDAAKRAEIIKEEMSKRMIRNGGKPLGYFLMPRSLNKRQNEINKGDD